MTVLDALGNMIAACEVAKIAFCRLPRHANGLCCLTGVGGCVVMAKAVEELDAEVKAKAAPVAETVTVSSIAVWKLTARTLKGRFNHNQLIQEI